MTFEEILRVMRSMDFHFFDVAYYRDGKIQTHCFRPASACNDSYSVAKAFVMTAVGLLYDDGKIDVHSSIGRYIPIPKTADQCWRLVTVENALTHRVGLREGFLDIDKEDVSAYPSDDFLSMVFARPLCSLPGTAYVYSDAAYYLLSRLVTQVSGETVDALLEKRIFRPMRYRETAWSRCPHGFPIGATGLYLRTDDMLKLGLLYLLDGVFEGKRLLSSAWIQTALAREYEFQVLSRGGWYGKGGMYGQMLAFSREKGYVFACHAHEANPGKKLFELLDQLD